MSYISHMAVCSGEVKSRLWNKTGLYQNCDVSNANSIAPNGTEHTHFNGLRDTVHTVYMKRVGRLKTTQIYSHCLENIVPTNPNIGD